MRWETRPSEREGSPCGKQQARILKANINSRRGTSLGMAALQPQDWLRHPSLDSRRETTPPCTDTRKGRSVTANVAQGANNHLRECGRRRGAVRHECLPMRPPGREWEQRGAYWATSVRSLPLPAASAGGNVGLCHEDAEQMHKVQSVGVGATDPRMMTFPRLVILP